MQMVYQSNKCIKVRLKFSLAEEIKLLNQKLYQVNEFIND